MNTRSCSNCRHWFEKQCREGGPFETSDGAGVWPVTLPTDWCGSFDPSTRAKGQKAKITDQQVIDAVRVWDSVMTLPDGRTTPRAAIKRTDLISALMDLGITQTPALKRIEKLVRHGVLEMGNNPWPKDGAQGGIYVWLGATHQQVEPKRPEKPESTDLLSLIRQLCPSQELAMSLRSIVREIHHTMPMSVATASRRMIKFVEAGSVVKCETGYYAAPTASTEVET